MDVAAKRGIGTLISFLIPPSPPSLPLLPLLPLRPLAWAGQQAGQGAQGWTGVDSVQSTLLQSTTYQCTTLLIQPRNRPVFISASE